MGTRTANAWSTLLRLGCAIVAAATAWAFPSLLTASIGGLLALGLLMVAWDRLTSLWVAWVLVAALSLEMALSDLIGPDAFQPTIAVVKASEIGLVAVTVTRFGMVPNRFNPALGFAAIAAMNPIAGIHPDLTIADMWRSMIGSVAPFLVFFCAKPPGWGAAILKAITFAPALSVLLGFALDLAGLRPVLVESGGLRLAGLGHPAFLAGVCLPAIYAGFLHWLRAGLKSTALVVGVNLVILLLTGARAPAAYAAIVLGGSLIVVPDAALPRAHRLVLVAVAMLAVPMLLIIGETYSSLRLFETLAGEAGNLSGRDLIWPEFEAAAAQAPWFGWGIGSGNLVIPHGSQLAQLLGTSAAHNEYLRIQVEGGYVGRTLLIALFVAWVTSHTARLPRLERCVMRLIFMTYAAHAATDNVLISTPACVFFAFVTAVYAAADDSATNRLRNPIDVA